MAPEPLSLKAPMSDETARPELENAAPGKPLTPAARRALEEAAARRAAEGEKPAPPYEDGGPKGPEPTRYGDWEKGGRAIDF